MTVSPTARFCDQKTVSEKIWPQLLPSFADPVPQIRCAAQCSCSCW